MNEIVSFLSTRRSVTARTMAVGQVDPDHLEAILTADDGSSVYTHECWGGGRGSRGVGLGLDPHNRVDFLKPGMPAEQVLRMGDRVLTWDGAELIRDGKQVLLKDVLKPGDSHTVVVERERAIKQIETTVSEVNEIFIDLGKLVAGQTEQINTISSAIENTVEQTVRAREELQLASRSKSRLRSRICCLMLGSIIAGLLLVIVMNVHW